MAIRRPPRDIQEQALRVYEENREAFLTEALQTSPKDEDTTIEIHFTIAAVRPHPLKPFGDLVFCPQVLVYDRALMAFTSILVHDVYGNWSGVKIPDELR